MKNKFVLNLNFIPNIFNPFFWILIIDTEENAFSIYYLYMKKYFDFEYTDGSFKNQVPFSISRCPWYYNLVMHNGWPVLICRWNNRIIIRVYNQTYVLIEREVNDYNVISIWKSKTTAVLAITNIFISNQFIQSNHSCNI